MMLRPRCVAYSVGELAQLSGLTKRRVVRLLVSNNIRLSTTGNKRIVFVSDLEAAFPELMDSIRLKGGDDDGQ